MVTTRSARRAAVKQQKPQTPVIQSPLPKRRGRRKAATTKKEARANQKKQTSQKGESKVKSGDLEKNREVKKKRSHKNEAKKEISEPTEFLRMNDVKENLEEMKMEMKKKIEQIGEDDHGALLKEFDIEVESRIEMMMKYQERVAKAIREILGLKLLLLPAQVRNMPYSEFIKTETGNPDTPAVASNPQTRAMKTPRILKRLRNKRSQPEHKSSAGSKLHSEVSHFRTEFRDQTKAPSSKGVKKEIHGPVQIFTVFQGGKELALSDIVKEEAISRDIKLSTLRRLRMMRKDINSAISTLSAKVVEIPTNRNE